MTTLATLMAACPNLTVATVGDGYSITRLMADIDLANNGYIPLAYLDAAQLRAVGKAKERGIVAITHGTVHRVTTEPELHPVSRSPLTGMIDGPDYEALILSADERRFGDH